MSIYQIYIFSKQPQVLCEEGTVDVLRSQLEFMHKTEKEKKQQQQLKQT
jgi:hypothetical protein